MSFSDVSSERAVLSSLFNYGRYAYDEVADIVMGPMFSDEKNQLIYRCFEYIFVDKDQTKADYPSLISAINDLNFQELNTTEEKEHLVSITRFPVEKDNIRTFAKKLKNVWIAKKAYETLQDTALKYKEITGSEPVNEIIGHMEDAVFSFTSTLIDEDDGPRRVFQSIRDRIEFLGENPVDQIGISTGFPLYDQAIGGGLRRATVNVIGARPKTGKTMMAENIGIFIASENNIPVLDLDTEMRLEDHQDRGLARISQVDINRIETGKFSKNKKDTEAINKAVPKYENIPYFHKNISGMNFQEQIAMMRRWINKEVGINPATGKANDCVIIYDYLKLMDTEDMKSDNLAEFQMLGFMMTQLHNFAVKFDIPILTFIQLNRDGITKESSDSASGSDRIIWLCSNFTIYKHKSDEEIAADGLTNGDRKLVPVLARHGEGLRTGEYINVAFNGPTATILEKGTNLSNREQNPGGIIEGQNSTVAEADIPF